jgi:colicin import membrane protein
MKTLKVTIVLMLFCQAVLAQEFSPEQIATKRVGELDQKVSLSETQKTEVTAIFKASATQMQALKKSEVVDKDAIHSLRKDEREKVKALLTADQQKALKEANQARKDDHKASRDKIREYHKTNVKPVILGKRKAFNAKLSAQEKAVITQARALKPKHEKGNGKKQISEAEKEQHKVARNEIKLLLKPIVDTHKVELEAIAAELKPTLDAEKEFKKANRTEKQNSERGVKGAHQKGKGYNGEGHIGDDNKLEHFIYQFLLAE